MRKLVLLSLLALAACAARGGPQATPAPAQSGTLARIHALVGTPSCTEDSQCHSLPVGARPCGGPESYLAFSTVQTAEPDLRALGERYADERRAANHEAKRVSTCLFMVPPGAACRAGTCQLDNGQPVAR